MRTQRSILPGVILVIIGVAFLGEMSSWWSLNWQILLGLWPIYLIAVGVRLLLPVGQRSDWLLAFFIVIGAAAIISAPAATVERLTGVSNQGTRSSTISQDGAANITLLSLGLNVSATTLKLSALDTNDTHVYTAASHGSNLNQSYRVSGSTANADISQTGNWLNNTGDIELHVARLPQLNISLNAGASQLSLDLRNLNVQAVKLDGGATNAVITFGTQMSHQTLNVDGGADKLTIKVPSTTGLKITNDSGLSGSNLDSLGLTKSDNTYTSAGFDEAAQQLKITLDGGASSFTIERY